MDAMFWQHVAWHVISSGQLVAVPDDVRELDPEVRERYLGIIEGRCVSGVNGAVWQTRAVEHFERHGADRPTALRRMLEAYAEHMDSNEPVHTWSVP